MILDLIVYIIAAVILYYMVLYLHHIWNLQNYPAGPFPLPVIGNVYLLDSKKPFQSFSELGKKYGDVYSISIGMKRFVIVNAIEPTKEALVEKFEDFSGRPNDSFILNVLGRNGMDLVFSDYGPEWHGKKVLVSKALKMFSEKDSTLEEKCIMEAKKISERLSKYSHPIDPEKEFRLTTCSLICNIVFGEHYTSLEDERFLSVFTALQNIKDGFGNDPTPVFPWLRYFPISVVRLMKEIEDVLFTYISKRFDEHQQLCDNHPKDFMSWMVMAARNKELLKHHGINILTRNHVEILSSDILLSGSDGTASILLWLVLYFLYYPEYQKDAFDEMQHVLGISRYPTLQDRSSLPKTMAIIQEVLRIKTVPLSIPRKATRDSSIAGNTVKKGTQILFNIWNIHRDERHWEDAKEFKPYRWLDEQGKFDGHKYKHFLPFLIGKRSCIGEQIARAEIFLVLSRFLIDFKIEKDPNQKLPSLEDGRLGITLFPMPFNILLTKR